MKKKLTLFAALITILTLIFSSLPGCAAKPTPTATPGVEVPGAVKWRWQHDLPTTSPYYGFAQEVMNDFNVAAGGRVVIELLPQGTVCSNLEILDAVAKGTVELGTCPDPWDYADRDPSLYLVGNIGMAKDEHMVWYFDKGYAGKKACEDAFDKHGVHWIYWDMSDTAQQYSGNKSLATLADWKGAKVAATGFTAKVLAEPEFGAVVSTVKEADLYAALEKGTIDAAIVGLALENWALNLQKVAKYAGFPGMHRLFRAGGLLVNSGTWNALTDDLKLVFYKLCTRKTTDHWAWQDSDNARTLVALKNAGITLVTQDKDLQRAWFKVITRLADQIAEKNADFKKIWDVQKAAIDNLRPYLKMMRPNYEDPPGYKLPPGAIYK